MAMTSATSHTASAGEWVWSTKQEFVAPFTNWQAPFFSQATDEWRADLLKTFDLLERLGLFLFPSCDDSATPPRQSCSAQMSDSPSDSPLLLHRLPFKAIEKDFQHVDFDHAVDS